MSDRIHETTAMADKRSGDVRAWFEGVVTENYRYLYVVAYRVLRNQQDAEDAVQTGVLKGLRHINTLDDSGAVLGWLARIVRNAALDMTKKGGSHKTQTVGEHTHLFDRPSSGQETTFNDDERDVVFEEIEKLPENQSQVLLLRHVEGLEIEEIAERLGINTNTTRIRLFRAYEKLRGNDRIRNALGMEQA